MLENAGGRHAPLDPRMWKDYDSFTNKIKAEQDKERMHNESMMRMAGI